MKIKVLFSHPDYDDLKENIKRGTCHYICFAIPGLTYSAEMVRMFTGEEYRNVFYDVNSHAETGTLYPMANITILPVTKANYFCGTIVHREEEFTEAEIMQHLKDVVVCNDTYIHAKEFYLDLRDFGLCGADMTSVAETWKQRIEKIMAAYSNAYEMTIIAVHTT